MEWQLNNSSKLNDQEVAQEFLQIYMESLQDHNRLKNILSEHSILDYFGKSFYGQEEVCTQLMANLYGSNFELSSLTTDEKELSIDWNSFCDIKAHKTEDELGVSFFSTPTSSFPGLTFSTPLRTNSSSRKILMSSSSKRSSLESSFEQLFELKKCKFDGEFHQGLQTPEKELQLSPKPFPSQIPHGIRFLSCFGTICYFKRVLATSDPKKIKHHSIGTPRDRFCHLYVGFQCDEHFISVTNCKIWIIKYEISSKVTPRNLLKSFNESDFD